MTLPTSLAYPSDALNLPMLFVNALRMGLKSSAFLSTKKRAAVSQVLCIDIE
jgi:hypothetical protein